mmetsp:Transcript_34283/g.105344  ORF Transcript_34283/g.105344 Transcript_34283/m.105344 type:complete len:325 (+) Transcript_34283:78-1052(+)
MRAAREWLKLSLAASAALASDDFFCPPARVVNRVADRVPATSPPPRGDDPTACVSVHLRRLMHAFTHELPPGVDETRRGVDQLTPEAKSARVAACRSALRARGVARESWRSCRSNAGGDTLLANREFYDAHLHRLAAATVRVLCVGVFRGESLAVWSEFFRRGTVVGLDINLTPATRYRPVLAGLGAWQNGNVELLQADTTDSAQFRAFVSMHSDVFGKGFDVIIDDGCHTTKCILATFDHLSDFLRPGGVYFVEDNDAHYGLISTRRQWAYAALKNGSVPDALNTSGSEHHSIISVFKRPGFSPPPTSGGGRLSAGRRAAVVR